MNKRAPIGIDDFGKLVNPENNYIFVDRTPLLKQIINEGSEVIVMHAFRRMGKSLFASMLHHFFSPEVIGVPTNKVFDHLLINQQESEFVQKHQGQYPVVTLNLKNVQETHYEKALEKMQILVNEAYRSHLELLNSPRLLEGDKAYFNKRINDEPIRISHLDSSIQKLTELLYKHHGKKAWIIIDEYDAPLATAYQKKYFPELLAFMRNFLGTSLKSNPYLEKGVLFGILRLTKESILSGLNNPKICTLLQPFEYNPYFGFTEDEVSTLFAQVGLAHEIDHVRTWYNGYHVDGQSLYNPWSIINCIDNKGELRPYWVNTASDELLNRCLLNAADNIKKQFEQLVINGKPVKGYINERIRFEDLEHDEDALWSLLFSAGYLTAEDLKPTGVQYEGLLRIPNTEVRWLYLDIFKSNLTTILVGHNTEVLKALIEGDIEYFAELLEEYLLSYASVHHLKYEGCYHSLVLGLLFGIDRTHYLFSGTLESGRGYSDLLLIPKEGNGHEAILIEFKHTQKNETGENALAAALKQINSLQYQQALKQYSYVTSVLKVGMAFSDKKVYWLSESQQISA